MHDISVISRSSLLFYLFRHFPVSTGKSHHIIWSQYFVFKRDKLASHHNPLINNLHIPTLPSKPRRRLKKTRCRWFPLALLRSYNLILNYWCDTYGWLLHSSLLSIPPSLIPIVDKSFNDFYFFFDRLVLSPCRKYIFFSRALLFKQLSYYVLETLTRIRHAHESRFRAVHF